MSRMSDGHGSRSNSRTVVTRPDSSKLAELHVYLVPPELYRDRFNNVLNSTLDETVSVGFIRVPVDTKLYTVREDIDFQIGGDSVPRDYVFLKSVGRSLTRSLPLADVEAVKPKQEYQLKVKNFCPPLAYMPEIYLLEVTSDLRAILGTSDTSSVHSLQDTRFPPLSRDYDQYNYDDNDSSDPHHRHGRRRQHYHPDRLVEDPSHRKRYKTHPYTYNTWNDKHILPHIQNGKQSQHNHTNRHSVESQSSKSNKSVELPSQHASSGLSGNDGFVSGIIDDDGSSTVTPLNYNTPLVDYSARVGTPRARIGTPRDRIGTPNARTGTPSASHNSRTPTQYVNQNSSHNSRPNSQTPTQARYDAQHLTETHQNSKISAHNAQSHDSSLSQDNSLAQNSNPKHSAQHIAPQDVQSHDVPQNKTQNNVHKYDAHENTAHQNPAHQNAAHQNPAHQNTAPPSHNDALSENTAAPHGTSTAPLFSTEPPQSPRSYRDAGQLREDGDRDSRITSPSGDVHSIDPDNNTTLHNKRERGADDGHRSNNGLTKERLEEHTQKHSSDSLHSGDGRDRRKKSRENENNDSASQRREDGKDGDGRGHGDLVNGEVGQYESERLKGDTSTNNSQVQSDHLGNIVRRSADPNSENISDNERYTKNADGTYGDGSGHTDNQNADSNYNNNNTNQDIIANKENVYNSAAPHHNGSQQISDKLSQDDLKPISGNVSSNVQGSKTGEGHHGEEGDKGRPFSDDTTLSDEDYDRLSPGPYEHRRVLTDEDKKRIREKKEALTAELNTAREQRRKVERKREEMVKKAKNLQTKTQNRRNHTRDIWKKRYFEEKKQTAPLEDQTNRYRADIEQVHRKLMGILEAPKEQRPRPKDEPSSKTNLKIRATKLQHDNADIQRRIDTCKMKLTSEMKLRNQAESEMKSLRTDLTQKKINLTLTRSQQLASMSASDMSFAGQANVNTPRSQIIG